MITNDDLAAELRRLAPPPEPSAKEGWFTVKQAAAIWGCSHPGAKRRIVSQVEAGTIEPWPGNHPKKAAFFRIKPKNCKNRW